MTREADFHHVVVLEADSVRASMRAPTFPHRWTEYPATSEPLLAERLADATIAIVNKVPLRGPAIAGLPRLKMVAVAATGTDNVDLMACREAGIVVSNVRGYAVRTVPEHVLMLMLALRRNLPGWRMSLAAGNWQRSTAFCLFDHPIRDLHGSTLGIVGGGSLGQGVARLAEAFGMHVLLAERRGAGVTRPGRTPFDEVLRAADVLTLHCPLNEETRHLIGAAELAAMKPGSVLINTARGGLVDESALLAALQAGTIAGAGIDVLSVEPPVGNPPLLAADLPNLIVTPHVAWSSREAMQALADQCIDNIEAFVAGAPRNRVA